MNKHCHRRLSSGGPRTLFAALLFAAALFAAALPVFGDTGPFPTQVVDSRGKTLVIKTAPGSVVSLAPSLTEVLFAVGAGEIVKGVTTYCNYPPEAVSIEKIGGFSAKTISIEAILALQPDIVFADLTRHGSVVETLERYGITVVVTDATTIDEIYDVIRMTGAATGNKSTADALIESMRSRIDSISRITRGIPLEERPRVFWEVFDEPLMTAGPDTFIGQLIDIAGGVNIFSDVSESWPKISDEELLSRNPEVLMSSDSHGEKFTLEILTARTGWQALSAVKSGRAYLFDGDMVSRPGPRIADVLSEMAAALHPELFQTETESD